MKLTDIISFSFLLALGAGCVDIEGPARESLSPSDVFAEIKIKSEAIMIARGDSHRIEIDLIAMNEDTIPYDVGKITWTSLETQTVSVTPEGVIYGKEVASSPINIIASYTYKSVTKMDTVSVYVTDGKIDANEIRLTSLDSNRIGAFPVINRGYPRVRVDLYKDGALVEKGSLIPIQVDEPASAVADGTGGPDMEPVYRITNDQLLIGKFWVRASLNLYGNEVADSISFTGLYNSMPSPIIAIGDIPEGYAGPIPLLDTIPLRLYQLCSTYMIMNLSSSTVDILFSDSTASSTDCDPGPPGYVASIGLPPYGEIIGGNVLAMPPMTLAVRKSRTAGVISYIVRNSSTQQVLPWFTGHIKQTDVQE